MNDDRNKFCRALEEKNTAGLLAAPKSDIHNHSVKGCRKAWLEDRLKCKFPDSPDRFDGSAENEYFLLYEAGTLNAKQLDEIRINGLKG